MESKTPGISKNPWGLFALLVQRKQLTRLDEYCGSDGMPFGKKEIKRIGLADLEAKRIKIYRTIRGRVNAAKVNGQLPVDKDPNIVIARKSENFAPLVDKFCM